MGTGIGAVLAVLIGIALFELLGPLAAILIIVFFVGWCAQLCSDLEEKLK